MNRILILLIVSLVWPAASFGQAPKDAAKAQASPAAKSSASLPAVDQILEKYVQAIGGAEAVRKITSRVIKGRAEGSFLPDGAPWEFYAKAPNRALSTVEIGGFGVIRDGFDGKVAWSHNPAVGVIEKTGDELAKARRDAVLHRDLQLKTLYPNLAGKGMEKVGAEETHVLEAKPSATSVERLYFSAKTGLLVRQDSEYEAAAGRIVATSYIEEYREVDGVKLPAVMRLNINAVGQGEMIFTMKFTEIKHNVPVEDAKFGKPSA